MSFLGVRSFVHTQIANDSIKLPLVNGTLESLGSLVKENVPELKDGTYDYLSPGLFNGNMQTMYAGAGKFEDVNKVYYGRRIITFPDENNSIVSADYLIPPPSSKEEWTKDLEYSPLTNPPKPLARTRYLKPEEIKKFERKYTQDDKPLLVVLHGLSGGSHESYVRAVVDDISQGSFSSSSSSSSTSSKKEDQHPFDCVVLNSRGCARTPITTPQLFCAIWTDDIRRFVQILHKEQPGRRLYLVGFSLGASILANYLGQQGSLATNDALNRVEGAIIVANPWDLNHSNQYLNTSFMGQKVYSPVMAKNLINLVKHHKDVLAQSPVFDYENRKKVHTIAEFDDYFTAPLFGFDSSKDYYRSASSVHRIMNIKVPTLILNALDDPIVHHDCIPYKEAAKNPYLVLSTTSLGGHIGWFQPGNKLWYPPVISKFFKTLDINVDHIKGTPNVKIDRPKRLLIGDRLVMAFHNNNISNSNLVNSTTATTTAATTAAPAVVKSKNIENKAPEIQTAASA